MIDCSLATRNRCSGWGDVGNLEGSTGPRRVVQSLWSGAAAAVHRLACPRLVSGRGESHDRVAVGVVVIQAVVIEMRRAPAGGQSERWARAMWTRSCGTNATAKGSAFVASLLSDEARLALRAFVDDAGTRDEARE